ncbi:(2Fe-2S)-binding protein [Pseudohoeflea coraliihabitans]|uniref:(2Fe-2S)-binding protein n=1 Tax=Pseudohoeflea coraliihabitans TaxID=2860393 RepID=A0ABS6WP10_9HYPH|nr:(2Fe-2S)-binding protein [Pseudohoeflea sp. DP4N28-3]MBW3097699.1 (2Fe-2S)-binding protein [Pseudohoeflea sp. DP4N28-3]
MLICQCNIIAKREIEATVRGFLDDDPWQIITPLRVYHALHKRGRCCGCFPDVVGVIVETTQAWHRDQASPEDKIVDFVARLKAEHARLAQLQAENRARMKRARGAA